MATDARISTGLPSHPKTKKLVRRLGPGAGWGLVCLFLWTASNRSDGDLSGMSTEDIELAADWDGDDGAFVNELCAVRFLDGDEGCYVIHDWAEHNPWAAGAESRSLKAKWNAAKRHHGIAEADRLFPEYAAIRNASSTDAADDQQADVEQVQKRSNAPSPSPSPSPLPKPSEKTPRKRSEPNPDRPMASVGDLAQAGIPADVAAEFIAHKAEQKAPLTERAWRDHLVESTKAGWTPLQAAEKVMAKNWKGFEAKYVANEQPTAPRPTFAQQASDIARTTVPARAERDPALAQIESDRARAAPIPDAIRKQLASLKFSGLTQ